MPIPMTALEIAERILEILVKDLGLQPGQAVPDQKLKVRYRAGSGDSADIKVGLEYAEEQGWLRHDDHPTNPTWYLTELGHQYP